MFAKSIRMRDAQVAKANKPLNHIGEREYLRFIAIRGMGLINTQNSTLIGYLENLSVEGMMLTSESPQTVGQEYDVKLFLGKDIDGNIAIRCRVRNVWSDENLWCGPNSSQQYCAGFEITSISDADLETLHAVIEVLEREESS